MPRSTASRGHEVLGIRHIFTGPKQSPDHDEIWILEAAVSRNGTTEVNAPSNIPKPPKSNEIKFVLISVVSADFFHAYVGLVC